MVIDNVKIVNGFLVFFVSTLKPRASNGNIALPAARTPSMLVATTGRRHKG
jgi:hypothetical protein